MNYSTPFVILSQFSAQDLLPLQGESDSCKRNRATIRYGQTQKRQNIDKGKIGKNNQKVLIFTYRLDFQISNDQELKVLCDCVERAVLEKHKMLRGDHAF